MSRSTVIHCDHLYIVDGIVEEKCGASTPERLAQHWTLGPRDLCPRHSARANVFGVRS